MIGSVNQYAGDQLGRHRIRRTLGPAIEPLIRDTGDLRFGEHRGEKIERMIQEAFYLNIINLPEASAGEKMTDYETSERVKNTSAARCRCSGRSRSNTIPALRAHLRNRRRVRHLRASRGRPRRCGGRTSSGSSTAYLWHVLPTPRFAWTLPSRAGESLFAFLAYWPSRAYRQVAK